MKCCEGDKKICVIIPTYNNATTIRRVIEDVEKYCSSIIVVNDGSTDDTAEILQSIPLPLKLSLIPKTEERAMLL